MKLPVRAENVGVFLIDKKRRIFCVHNARGFNPPGGAVETNDFSYFSAASREFVEESGSKLPLAQHQMSCAVYKNRARTAVIFYNRYALDETSCKNLIEDYSRKKIKFGETSDVAFVPLQILAHQSNAIIQGERYFVRGRIARFVPRVSRFLEKILNSP